MSGRFREECWIDVRVPHHVPVQLTRLPVAAAVGLLTLTVLGGCNSGSDSKAQGPDAGPDGLFPHTYSEQGFPAPLTLLKPTAATAQTSSYSVKADAGDGHPFALVANCTTGNVIVKTPGVTSHKACQGGAMAMMSNCSGDPLQVTVRVTEDQRRKWGLAVYRMPHC